MRRFSWIALLLVLVMLIPATAGAAAYDHVLKQGMRDSTDPYPGAASDKDIEYMQQRLKYYEYYTGNIDGIYGPKMAAAVKAFQKRNNLDDDGVAGPGTLEKLYSNSAKKANNVVGIIGVSLKKGSEGDAVRVLQTRLKALGYLSGLVDGSFGTATEEAVKAAWDRMASREWDVFQQDVYDNNGNLIPASTFTDDYLYSGMTDLLVQGVYEK